MPVQWTRLAETFRSLGFPAVEGEPMSGHTSFKIGGPADVFVTVPDGEGAAAVLSRCREAGAPVFVMGNGSNLLVGDGGIEGVVLKIETAAPPVLEEGGGIVCPAGLPVKKLCLFARDQGLSGLEFAFGIPGAVGGGVYMNAGAYGGQLSDVLTGVTVLTRTGETRELSSAELRLGYRRSVLMETGDVVVQARFCLTPDEREAIAARMEEYLRRRRDKQPLEYPSAGSFFKRPPGHFAGALIESCGLKGKRVGGAQISEKHAGFLINAGGATCADVLELSRQVRETVYERTGVSLEPEVRPVGRGIAGE